MNQGRENPQAPGHAGRDWLVAAAALAVTLLAAVLEGWQATDIVWGMWISSLVSGYAMIVTAIIAALLKGRDPAAGSGAAQDSVPPLRARLGGALFMLAFFSVHFGFFHAGHAMFTQHFFPLPGVGDHELPGNFLAVTPLALAAYWPVVLASLVARRDGFRTAAGGESKQAMLQPYHYVVKNHLMIFIVIGCTLAGLQGWLLYVLFLWYFAPPELWQFLKAGRTRAPRRKW